MKNIVPFPATRPVVTSRSIRAAAVRSVDRCTPVNTATDLRRLLLPSLPHHQRVAGRTRVAAWFHFGTLFVLSLMLYMALSGCGGGYAGSGISSVTASAATIDAGQTLNVSATESGSLPITWSLAGSSCSGSGCGTLASMGSGGDVFTAPAGISSPLVVTITASIAGTGDTRSTTVTVNPDPAISGVLPAGTVGTPYSATLHGSGGTGALQLGMAGGALPAGLSFNASSGVISGTPTTAGGATFVAQVTDSAPTPFVATASESITIAGAGGGAPLTMLSGNPPTGFVAAPYATALSVTGGIAPYTFSVTSGSLPAGLALGSGTGVISGLPTAAGTATFTAQVQDSTGAKATASFSISILSSLSIMVGPLPNGTVGVPYSSIIGVTGGTAPYTCTVTSGTLPAGLSLGAGCAVTGTPTTAGTATLTVKATDSSNPVLTTTGPVSLTISPAGLSLSTGTLPAGTVGTPYSSTIGVTGGTSPYSCVLTSGTLQAGLTLGANCLVSGTPTVAGTVNLTVKATDSSNPTLTVTGPVSLTINPTALAISTGTLPAGTVGTPYSSTIGVTGGTSPYSCTITSGTLQAGLTLGANCLVSGTPTASGTVNLTVKAIDSSNPMLTAIGPVSLTINPAALAISSGTLPAGTVGTPYSSTIGVTGGTSPYSCTITSGTLQAGLTLGANCLVSGTPTASGTVNLTVKATDSSNPTLTVTGPVSLTINPATITLILTAPAPGTVGTPYSGTVGVSGGTGPYTCALKSGTLQSGLTLNTNCTITGTPITSGTSTIILAASDSSSPTNTTTGSVAVTIAAATVTLTIGNPPVATAGTPYTGVIPVTGGTGPYTCNVANGGALPAGLAFSTGCTLTGTPTKPGITVVQITATDSANPPNTTMGPVTITVQAPAPLIFTGTLPNAILNQPYTQTLAASGGVGPYTYAVTSGTLPAGLSLNTSTGVVSGTPTAPGASAFTITATDSESTPQTAALPLTLLVVYAPTTNDALLQGPYAFLFQGYDDLAAGVLAYQTATVGSFTANGSGVLTAGELDSNHQASNPTGATVPTNALLGTYTLGADDRGTLVISTFNADGTVAATTTYTIAVKAPVSPATSTARGSMVEADHNLAFGQRGSGTFLQQTATAFSTGLTGSYAFGFQGDIACLPACTANLQGGPAATVGQMTTASGAVTGEADTNLAQTNYPTAALTGTYGTADGNGRVQLSLTNPNIPYSAYPSDFALYMVNASQAFVMSTDKHSAYILLAGSATSQSTSTFSNASLSGQYVGYENAPTNPGLAGVALQSVANLPTATIFQGTANSTGTCTTNYVDQGGTTALVNALTGQGSGSNVLNALLGTYESTGTSGCTVGTNGRTVLNYPVPSNVLTLALTLLGLSTNPPAPRVAYLTGTNAGYFLETGYAGLGNLEQQTGAPFSLATLNGTYVYGTAPAAAAVTLDASGEFTANGAGHASYVLDENVIAGNQNAVTLGVTGSGTYVLTDAQNGRFTFGTGVIFAISPTRFVLVDESALTTAPSVALIY